MSMSVLVVSSVAARTMRFSTEASLGISRLIPNDPAVENLIVLAATELTTKTDIDMLGECLHAALNGDGA